MSRVKNQSRLGAARLAVCAVFSLCALMAYAGVAKPTAAATAGDLASAKGVAATVSAMTPPKAPPGGAPGVAKLASQASSTHFSDLGVTTAAVNAYIDYLYEKGLILGYEGLYYPDKALSRADLAVMLYGKYKYATEGFSYGDVATDAYYYQAVMRGKASGIFENNKYFFPDESVTREQAALWIFKSELKNGMPSEFASTDLSSFKDAASISEDAKKAVATMTKLGILSADADGNFNAKGSFTRAEIAVVIYRLLSLGGGAAPGAGGAAPGAGGPGGAQTVDHGKYASKVVSDLSGGTFVSTGDTENALRVEGDVVVKLSGIAILKTAGASGSGDTSNFYGSNAGLLALDGAKVTIDRARVDTSTRGGNGIFSYGSGTIVTVNDSIIRTAADSSGGVMVTGGGTMFVNDCDIETQGGSSAALRTDRGGGTLVVKGGTYVSHGNGSPAIYSTAAIAASGATLTATGSEAVVVEGKNSVALKDCVVTGNMIKENVQNLQNVMIYQSMSGDAASGKSSFSMEGGSLTSRNGDMFYVTNTTCSVKLSGVELRPSSDCLLKVVGNDARNGWGVVGKNGGRCEFVAERQDLAGKIRVDAISTLSLSLAMGSTFLGSINAENEGGAVALSIDATSSWSLSADSYLSSLSASTDRIVANGHKLYVEGKQVM